MEIPVTSEREIRTVRELIDEMAHARANDIFLISPETARILTFSELQRQSKALSARLREAGLAPGDKVAFLMDNGIFTVQLFLGTMYGGFVVVPLNVRAGVSQLAFTLDHCDANVLFVEKQYAALAAEALAGVSRAVRVLDADVDGFATDSEIPNDSAALETLGGEDVALLMYTSGSVGVPKAAIHSHRTVLAHARNSALSHKLTSADRSLLLLPIYHINAECVTLMPTLISGGSVVVPHHFNVSQFWDWLDDYRCTWSAVVPTIISQLLDWKDPKADRRDEAFRRIRFLRSSSAPLSPSLQREFLDKFNLLPIQAMGSSEAGNIFSNPQPPGENKIGTPGLAWGFETRIVNPDGIDVARGESGEVMIRGAAVMQGYFKDPEGTAAVLDKAGWLRTGDLAYQDQDGYFFVIGRSKELIIKGGMNIAPRQIDEVLESHPAILEAAVVGVPDHYLGEDLVGFVVLRSGMRGDEKEMLAFCEKRLGHFKTPTRIHFVNDLPKGPSGKVQRLRLLSEVPATVPAVHNNGHLDNAAAPAAIGVIEEIIARRWAEVLEHPQVDRDGNFFSLGGHSLMAIQCLSLMRDELPVPFSLSDFFEHPTIAEQVTLIEGRLSAAGQNGSQVSPEVSSLHWKGTGHKHSEVTEKAQTIPKRGKNLPYPLSSGQQRIWFFEELAPEVPLYNESEAVRLIGELRADALEQALNLIIARHEILRTTIQIAAERPIAVVHDTWPLQIKHIDLGKQTPAQREAEVDRMLIEEPRRPYHLEKEPGIRATLVRLGPTEHVFILMMHHLVCDWASEGTLWRELSAAYRAISRGEPVEFNRLPIQFGDYAVWQQQRVDEGAFADDLSFWENNLINAPELLDLPTDRPRPNVQSYRGSRQRYRLNATLTEALRDCSRREKASLFTVFAAAFNTLLYRYTGSEDILLGIPLADREQRELQSLIGFLLHTQVLRTQVSGTMTFRELLAHVQSGLVALYTHREAPFDQIVQTIRPQRTLSHTPLFQVMINWRDQDQHLSFIGMEGLRVESLLAETKTSKFDLTLMLTDFGSEIWLEAEYNTDLFDDDRIVRMFGHYETLLEGVAAAPQRQLAEFGLLTEAERRQLTVEWKATEAAFPDDKSISQLLESQADLTPSAIAVVFESCEVTYKELNERSNQLARYLRKLGIQADVPVGICVDRSIEMLVGLLGILKAGYAYLPLDPAFPRERLEFMLRDSQAALVLTQEKIRPILTGDYCTLCLDTDWLKIAKERTWNLDSGPSASDNAYLIYTSGSTGQPKGVEITHRSVVNLLSSMRKKPGLSARDTLAAVTTLSFDIAVLELLLPLSVGAKLVIVNREVASDGGLLLDWLSSCGATVIQATPITFRLLIEAGWKGKPAMKILCGGEELPRELANEILARCSELWNMYGPTETTVWSSTIQVRRGDGAVPIGPPIDNTQFCVLDVAGQPAPIGVVGELNIAGVGLARGYLNRPELTAQKFVSARVNADRSNRLYKTGDLVRRRADGSLEFLGRLDNQVKLRGFRIELGEIEAAIAKCPGVGQSVVTVRDDGSGEKLLVAYVVPLDERGAPGVEEVRETLKRRLPDYMIPTSLVALEKLPLTPNGKIDRKALPAPDLNGANPSADYVAPRTPMEEAVAKIWIDVLRLKQVGVHDDFFALGGHSLLAMRLIGTVQKSITSKISVAEFFRTPTVEGMAKVIQDGNHIESEDEQKEFRLVLREGTKSLAHIPENARLVALRAAQRRVRPPFFVVNSYPYFIDVVKLLDADQPVLSLVAKEIMEASSHYDLVREAAAHVETILEYAPHGPYVVGGFCASGIVAYEVAQQLVDRRHNVELLVLFDTVNPHFMKDYSPLRRSVVFNWPALRGTRWVDLPKWLMSKGTNLIAKRLDRFVGVGTQARGEERSLTSDEFEFSTRFGFSPVRIAAARKYRPKPYNGNFLLFKSHRQLGGRYLDPHLGWGGMVSGRTVVTQLSTNEHLEIFKSEFDRALVAQELRRAFEEVPAIISSADPTKGNGSASESRVS